MIVPKSATTTAAALLSLRDNAQGSVNYTAELTGFEPCDALIGANLSQIVHMPSSPLYEKLVNGSWTPDTRKEPWCFVQPRTTMEVSQCLVALDNAGEGAGDWHIAIRSGGHGGDNQNNIETGVIIDLTALNTTTYDAATNIAGVGTGNRWGNVYTALQEHGVSVTGGRQSVVGVGGLLLGGGVGWTTPRTGFGCDQVVNYEVVLASGEIVNANASANSDLWKALKGGSSNFGIVTRFDIEAFPANNITLERRTVSEEHTDEFIDAIVGYGNLDQSFQDNAMVSVISYLPTAGAVTMTVAEVNTVNDWNTTAFDTFNRIPIVSTTGKKSYTLPGAAAVDAPELSANARMTGAGPRTILNDPRVVHYCFEQHDQLVADLNGTLGPQAFSTNLEFQPLPAYFAEIGVQRGGNMLGLDRNPRNKLYFTLGATLLTPESVKQLPQVYQKVAATATKITTFAKSIGAGDDFIYLPYADSTQDALGSYGAANVQHMKQVAKSYDPNGFFQKRVPGGFKIDRVA